LPRLNADDVKPGLTQELPKAVVFEKARIDEHVPRSGVGDATDEPTSRLKDPMNLP
jgi:hypothetical protein